MTVLSAAACYSINIWIICLDSRLTEDIHELHLCRLTGPSNFAISSSFIALTFYSNKSLLSGSLFHWALKCISILFPCCGLYLPANTINNDLQPLSANNTRNYWETEDETQTLSFKVVSDRLKKNNCIFYHHICILTWQWIKCYSSEKYLSEWGYPEQKYLEKTFILVSTISI